MKYFIMKMKKFINPLFCSTIPKPIISNVSSISNPLELKYLIKLFHHVLGQFAIQFQFYCLGHL